MSMQPTLAQVAAEWQDRALKAERERDALAKTLDEMREALESANVRIQQLEAERDELGALLKQWTELRSDAQAVIDQVKALSDE